MLWPTEKVELLKKLYAEGLSFSQIAWSIGGVTRNACIGKARRIDLPPRRAPSSGRRAAVPRQQFTKASSEPPPPPIAEKPPLVLEDGKHVTTMTLTHRMCHWPIGDPAEESFHYCGHGPRPGAPYCEAHAHMAFQSPPQRSPAS